MVLFFFCRLSVVEIANGWGKIVARCAVRLLGTRLYEFLVEAGCPRKNDENNTHIVSTTLE